MVTVGRWTLSPTWDQECYETPPSLAVLVEVSSTETSLFGQEHHLVEVSFYTSRSIYMWSIQPKSTER
jgi:hypothetical protein